MIEKFDIAVIGAGMVGLTAALAMSQESDLQIVVVDNSTEPTATKKNDAYHLRVSAINQAASNAFKQLGVWQAMGEQRLSPYQGMLVWDKNNIGKIEFSATDVGANDLGYIIENQVVQSALWQACLAQANIEFVQEAVTQIDAEAGNNLLMLEKGTLIQAKLVIAADGAHSQIRKMMHMPVSFSEYGQKAIVATVKTEFPHQGIARQVFTSDGPLALLPLNDPHYCSIVFSQTSDKAEQLLALDEQAFNQLLMSTSDGAMGQIELVSNRQSFPLVMRYSRDFTKHSVVLIGDAAHTIHPLAGQGANLGIMDALAISEYIHEQKQKKKDIGSLNIIELRKVMRWRKSEAFDRIAAMELFHQGFTTDITPVKWLRGLVLNTVNTITPIKQLFIQEAMGVSGRLPTLAKSEL